MSLGRPNEFQLGLINSRVSGTAIVPGNNVFPASSVLFDSANADWWPADSGDAYEITIEVSNIAASAAIKDALLRIYYEVATSSVSAAADTFTYATPHGLETADGPARHVTSGVLPSPLVAATDYWVIRVDDNTVKWATSEANARAGIAIDITAAGSGTQTTTACKLLDLAVGAAQGSLSPAISYRFPLWIPRLTKIRGAISVNNATVGSSFVTIALACKPSKLWGLEAITFVRTFGSVPATSTGTALTPGNAVKGAYVQLGAALLETIRFWSLGCNIGNAVSANHTQYLDLAIDNAGNKRICVFDARQRTSTSEAIQRNVRGEWMEAITGETIHIRALNTAAPVTGFAGLAYGGGGNRAEPNLAACTVAGTVTIEGGPAANGKTVEIFAVDSDGLVELVATTTTAGGAGAFTIDLYEASRTLHFASFVDGTSIGRSAYGTPESSTFDITIGCVPPVPPLSNNGPHFSQDGVLRVPG